jgi:hypothetical protein
VKPAALLKNNQANQAHGGKRPNAGRKAGTGNKSNEIARRKAAETGETPLEYMLRVMRDSGVEDDRRDDMAKAAASYVHSKLASTTLTGADGGNLVVEVLDLTNAARSTA